MRKLGTAIEWRGTGGNYGISLESLTQNSAAQGAKGDMEITAERWANKYLVEHVMETGGSAPTKGGSYELWWAASVSPSAGSNNPGGTSGTDSAYKAGEVDEWKVQLIFIGRLIVTGDANTIMRQYFKDVVLPARWGMPVVVNKTDQTSAADHNEHYIKFHPILS